MPGISLLNDTLTRLLIALFSTKGVALALAGLILLAAIFILFGVYFSRVVPIRKAVTRRIVDFPRTVAPSELEQVSSVMARPDRQSFNLERAWAAFRSSLTFTPRANSGAARRLGRCSTSSRPRPACSAGGPTSSSPLA